jgi:hypothetical protein
MSGDHNMYGQRSKNSAIKTVSMHEFDCMRQTAESFKVLMDAHAKALDRAIELLHRAETEMRYAGWTKLESDNTARNGVYEQIKRFLERHEHGSI